MTDSYDQKKILEKIEEAFPFVEKPSPELLCVHEVGCWKCNDLREELLTIDSANIPSSVLRSIHQELSRLSSGGWKWVLPFYLRYVLSGPAVDEIEFLIYQFGPMASSDDYQDILLSLSGLDVAQIECLVDFLVWCKSSNNLAWSKYFISDINRAIEFLKYILRIPNSGDSLLICLC